LRTLAEREASDLVIETDSAGTAGYHIGAPPDARSQAAARRRGYEMSQLRARIVAPEDFEHFDLLLAMDRDNLATLRTRAPREFVDRVRLFMEYAPQTHASEVPDPYYGGPNGFEEVLDLVEAATRGLLTQLRRRGKAA